MISNYKSQEIYDFFPASELRVISEDVRTPEFEKLSLSNKCAFLSTEEIKAISRGPVKGLEKTPYYEITKGETSKIFVDRSTLVFIAYQLIAPFGDLDEKDFFEFRREIFREGDIISREEAGALGEIFILVKRTE